MLKLLVFLTLSTISVCTFAIQVHHPQKPPSQIIRIHAKGGSPFDSDILLPYSIIQNINHQQLAHKSKSFNTKVRAITRISPHSNSRLHTAQFPHTQTPHYRQGRTFLSALSWAIAASKHVKEKLSPNQAEGEWHLERDHVQTRNFKLYDDDGEHLLNMDDLFQTPTITNITTSFKSVAAHSDQSGVGGTGSSKKLVKHVWIHL